MTDFNGLGMNMGNLSRLSKAKSRSLSAENFTGEKGKGGMSTDGLSARCAPQSAVPIRTLVEVIRVVLLCFRTADGTFPAGCSPGAFRASLISHFPSYPLLG